MVQEVKGQNLTEMAEKKGKGRMVAAIAAHPEFVPQIVSIDIEKLEPNEGQLSNIDPVSGEDIGLPRNPRFIRDERFKALKRSITDDPEYLLFRPLEVFPLEGGKFIVVGGNQRLRACKELGFAEVPCLVFLEDTPMEKLRAWAIKDNIAFGDNDYDILANDWNQEELEAFGMELDWTAPGDEEETESAGERTDGEDDDYDVDQEVEERVKRGEIWALGPHRLMCGDSTDAGDFGRLMAGEKADLWLTDPPYNVNYGADMATKDGKDRTIMNDNMSDAAFHEFLLQADQNAVDAMKPGSSFYIFHADSEGYNFRGACREAGLTIRECLIWKKDSLVLGRQDYQWIHEPCHKAGTMILTTNGTKPIEDLTDDDRVISFDTYSGQVVGSKNGGYAIKRASRDYDGLLYWVSAGGNKTNATDNHEFSVRFNPDCSEKYCTYLMRRGRWWRVGHTRAYDARQFGVKSRYHQENAEEAWLIAMYESRSDAQVAEQILAIKYGIPYTHWEVERGMERSERNRSEEQVRRVYESIDLDELEKNAYQLLHDFGRSESFPLIDAESQRAKFSRRVTAKLRACNLIPGLMQVPVPNAEIGVYPNFRWESINKVRFEPFQGRVYSLAVEKLHHYVADGIVTHNCLYGWKDGAAHKWYSDRSQTTVLEFDRPKKSELHPTQKSIPLFVYLIQNSSKKGDIVLDSFGGSGTTIIACEQTGRIGYTMELDEHYASVIVDRWEKYTGKKAEKIE